MNAHSASVIDETASFPNPFASFNDAQARLLYALVGILLGTDDLTEGLRSALRAICEAQGWSAGRFWTIDERDGTLREFTSWQQASGAHQPVLHHGATVPRWLGKQPVWIGDLSAHELAALVRPDAGAGAVPGTGALVPIRSRGELIAVVDFGAPDGAVPGAEGMTLLRLVARHLCRYYLRGRQLEQLRESEQRAASTLELAAIGIAHVDDSGRFTYVNPQLCAMLGYTEKELLALSVGDVSHPDDVHMTDEVRDRLRSGEINSFKMEKRYVHKDGSILWVNLTVAVKRDWQGQCGHDIAIVEDISARKIAEDRVHYLATHDGLTGLPNRAMFGELLSLGVETARRHGTLCAVLFIDLDRFKIINDSLGHEAGDVLLREVASRLRTCVRASDVVARLGGDEFVVLLQDIDNQAEVSAVARSMLSAAMRPVVILGQECRVTASIGICVHPAEGQNDDALLKNADMAMYLAKEEGKNNFQFYTPALQAGAAGRLALESNLRRALERQEFTLHYQAKVNFRSGAITGVEALLRWQNEELGSVSPTQFIPVAEETGLIVPIGRWVLRTACAQNAQWLRRGLPPVRVSVNLSMRQLNDRGLLDDIKAALHDSGLPAELLELEMTESMIMHNAEHAIRVLGDIKSLGVRLAIDDFGTGYSSLAHLKRFPVDTLKVDRSFIREAPHDPEDRAITEAIIAMGKTLSLTIVAEGVETPEQQAFLSRRACDEMQGFYFSTPVPPDDFAALLERHAPVPRS
jgi:diguanylate cyclase (GGDEF)-like protein/PAS domain S-box-containing protein